MAIVTISRGTFTGGRNLASGLAEELGYRLMSAELLAEAAESYGIKQENLEKGLGKAPRFWDRFRIDRQIYLTVVRATLCKAAREDNLVFHGHAGHLLLQGVGQVLRVRVIAPMEMRIEAAMGEHRMDRKEAESAITTWDANRRSWTRFIYGVEWTDPALYDLVINLENVHPGAALALVADLSRRPEYQMTAAGLAGIDNLFLVSHVKAKLFLNPSIAAAAAKIHVDARGGEVYLSGVLPGESFLDEVLETAATLPEVGKVHAAWLGSYTPPV